MFFKYLQNNHYINQNYYELYSFRFKQEKRLPKTLTVQEVKTLIDYLLNQKNNAINNYTIWKSTRNLALLDILISTGIRIGEASNISLEDIILSEKTILIHGKGNFLPTNLV